MEKEKDINVEITESDKEKKSVIISQIRIQSIDRTPKDLKVLSNALEYAESPYLPNRAELLDIYKRIELDGHLTGVWEKRIASVLNKRLRFVNEEKKVDAVDELIGLKEFRRMLRRFMESKSHSVSGLEFIPGSTFCFLDLPRKHIELHSRKITFDQFGTEGLPYDTMWNVMIVGDKDDLGFFLKCAFYVLLKQGNYSDWAQFIEIFGHPFRIFEYDIYDENSKKEAHNLLENSGAAAGIVIPKQLAFRMEDGKTSNANGELQDKFKNAMNDEISVIVLGNTETTKSSSSSGYAQSETHSEQQDEIIMNDMVDILHLLNSQQFRNIAASYGYPVMEGHFEFEHEIDHARLKGETDIDAFLINTAKLPLDDDDLYKRYGRNKPANYEKMKKESTEQPDTESGANVKKKKRELAGKKNWKFLNMLTDFFVQARS